MKDILEKYLLLVRPYLLQVWRSRTPLIVFNLTAVILFAGYQFFLAGRTYESNIVILPDYGSGAGLGSLSDLAAIAGVGAGALVPTEIYQNIISSEAVIESVVNRRYLTKQYPDSVDLITYFRAAGWYGDTPEEEKRRKFLLTYQMMTDVIVSTSIDRFTKILTVSVRTPEPKLSADIANTIIGALDDYLRTKRKSYALNQRYYLEKRIAQVKDSLSHAEEQLKQFRTRNVNIGSSPQLLLESARLTRNMEMHQAIFMELSRQIEIIKIDEIRDAPVLNIREAVREPLLPIGVSKRFKLAVFMIICLAVSVAYVLLKDVIIEYIVLVRSVLRGQ